MLEVSSSQQQISSSQQQISASLLNVVANYATTGSNSFRADQSITGSLVVSSTITAQTLVVQTVTSSIVYSSGSNIFGSQLGNTQTFTGSIYQTGSIAAFAGSVGIGTTNPSYKLQVSSEMLATGYNLSNTGGSIQTIDAGAYITLLGATGVAATNAILLGTNGTEKIRITNSGSVGIGTTNPTAKLQVVPYNEAFADGIFVNQAASNQATIRFKSAHSADSDYRIGASILVNNAFEIYSVNASASRVVLTNSGSVGIGITTPTSPLTLAAASANFAFYNTFNNAQVRNWAIAMNYYNLGDMSFLQSTAQNGNPVTAGTARLHLNYDGNVGIGTTNPSYLLDVRSSASSGAPIVGYFQSAGGDAQLHVSNGTVTTQLTADNTNSISIVGSMTNHPLVIRTNNNEKIRITTGGLVGIGTTNPTYKFEIAGTTGTFTFNPNQASNMIIRGSVTGNFDINNEAASGNMRLYGSTIQLRIPGADPAVTIDSSGRVIKPYQPAFSAGKNTNSSVSAGATVIFQLTTGNKFNIGGHYNASTGIFTAPVAGVYIFSASLIWMSLTPGQDMHDSFWIYKNSSIVAYGLRRAEYEAGYTGNGGYFVDFANVLLSLAVGDTVKVVNNRALDIHGNSEYSYFYGYLLG